MEFTLAAHNMFDFNECATNVFHSIDFVCCLLCQCAGRFVLLDPCGRIIIGSCSTHACLWGFLLGTSPLSPVDCLRLLSMKIWLFTFRVMQLDISQEDNELCETWRPKNRLSLA